MTPEIKELKKRIIDNMITYMKYGSADDENEPDFDPDFDAGYTQKHIDKCSAILNEYLKGLSGISAENQSENILEVVKFAILKLNKLNDLSNGNLIETDQREDLCEFIITAANQAGLVCDDNDITEEWREW